MVWQGGYRPSSIDVLAILLRPKHVFQISQLSNPAKHKTTILKLSDIRVIISQAKATNIIVWILRPITNAKAKDQRASQIDLPTLLQTFGLHGFICYMSDAVFVCMCGSLEMMF